MKIFWLVVPLMSYSMIQASYAEDNPHTLTASSACGNCHVKQPDKLPTMASRHVLPQPQDFIKDNIDMCIDCHEHEVGHQVDIIIDFTIPADLPLDERRHMTCLTCHYTHGSLHSDQPQASYSFVDVLFDSERLRKSFLIRRNNVNGELCLICHHSTN